MGQKTSLKAVVVDDDPTSAAVLATCVRLLGHDAETIEPSNIDQLVDRLAQCSPDVAFIDLSLGQYSGWLVAERLRARGISACLVAVTGWNGEEDRKRAEAVGFNDYWVKPIEFANVEGLMSTLSAAELVGNQHASAARTNDAIANSGMRFSQ